MLWRIVTKSIPPDQLKFPQTNTDELRISGFQEKTMQCVFKDKNTLFEFADPQNFLSCCMKWCHLYMDDLSPSYRGLRHLSYKEKCDNMVPLFLDCLKGDLEKVLEDYFITTYVEFYSRYPDSDHIQAEKKVNSLISGLYNRLHVHEVKTSTPLKYARLEVGSDYPLQESDIGFESTPEHTELLSFDLPSSNSPSWYEINTK
ncbi:hypothetical protein RF11_14043 [Thelohanellus kitauei]|uniref:Uncharacterized protein n=1 Tax=Thelohanellus kitauei TaxID=669202 RepID=A0A0C2NI59_THEKT|nr:hypothetical protein RF11_14043 [Thelohanellus kitauei]